MTTFEEVVGIIGWLVDLTKELYLVEGVSIYLMLQIMIWVGVTVVVLRYGLDKFGG